MPNFQKNKDYETLYGSERAKEIREKISKGCKGKNTHSRKTFENIVLVNPQGIIFTRVESLTQFAKENKICRGTLIKLLENGYNGKTASGWELKKENSNGK